MDCEVADNRERLLKGYLDRADSILSAETGKVDWNGYRAVIEAFDQAYEEYGGDKRRELDSRLSEITQRADRMICSHH